MHFLIIITIIIILFIIYILIFVKKSDKYQHDPYYHYPDIRKMLKTGDIILFSCKKTKSFYKTLEYYFRTELLGSEYGHVGIIVKNNDKIFVVECVAPNVCADQYAYHLNNFGKGGVRIVELDILLEEYYRDNEAIFAIKFINKEIPYLTIMEKLKKYSNCIFDEKYKLFILGFIDICISHSLCQKIFRKNGDKIMCSEFVHSILKDCGILRQYPSKLFWPHLVTRDEVFDLLQNVSYSRPYKFIFEKENNNKNN